MSYKRSAVLVDGKKIHPMHLPEAEEGGGAQLFFLGAETIEQLQFTYDGLAVSDPVFAMDSGVITDEDGVATVAANGLYRLDTIIAHATRGAAEMMAIITTTGAGESYEVLIPPVEELKHPPRIYALPAGTTITVEVFGDFTGWDPFDVNINVIKMLG